MRHSSQDIRSKMIDSVDVRTLATEALRARVVSPSQAEIIHPPKLRFSSNSDVDADLIEVLECRVEGDRNELAMGDSRASLDCVSVGDDRIGEMSCWVVSKTSEGENAVWTVRITTKRCTINVEAEASQNAVISIANIARPAKLRRIGA